MKFLSRSVQLVGVILSLWGGIPDANANVGYHWQGECEYFWRYEIEPYPAEPNCSGQARAILTLTDSYVPGTAVSWFGLSGRDYFVSFAYHSSQGDSFTVAFIDELSHGSLYLPEDAGLGSVRIGNDGYLFNTAVREQPGDKWGVGAEYAYYEWGSNSVWHRIPEPSGLELAALGLVGVFALSSRRRAT